MAFRDLTRPRRSRRSSTPSRANQIDIGLAATGLLTSDSQLGTISGNQLEKLESQEEAKKSELVSVSQGQRPW